MPIGIVEGNIGAGKSTFLKFIFRHFPNSKCIEEWVPHEYLKYMYEDPETWGFPFQLIMAAGRIVNIRKAFATAYPEEKLVLVERSLEADRIFAKKLFGHKKELYNLYMSYYDIFTGAMIRPRFAIYIQSDPEKCLERIEKRQEEQPERECENKIDLSYLKDIHIAHERWMNSIGLPVFKFSIEEVNYENYNSVADLLERFNRFLKIF